VETSQLYSDYCNVSNALSGYLLYILYALLRDHNVRTTPLYLFLHPLHLPDLAFNCCGDYEGLVDPRLKTRLQNRFSVSRCIYLLLKRFGLLQSREPLCEDHHLHGPFDVVILLL